MLWMNWWLCFGFRLVSVSFLVESVRLWVLVVRCFFVLLLLRGMIVMDIVMFLRICSCFCLVIMIFFDGGVMMGGMGVGCGVVIG